MNALTPDDLELLRRPLLGFLTVSTGEPRPVWYEAADDGTIQLFTEPDSLKVRRARRDPRASLVVAAPVGEPERWVSVAGPVSLETEGAHELAARLAARYWDLGDPRHAAAAEAIRNTDQIRLVIRPETVRRYVY